MIIEEIIDIIMNIAKGFDNFDFIFSIIVFILPSFFKLIKIKLARYYPIIAGFCSYIFIMILINNIVYNNDLVKEGNFVLLILAIISLKEVYSGIRSNKFIEIYDVLQDYYFYKKIDINIVGFSYTDHDLERLKFIIRSNLNILSAYSKIGDLSVKIENKKTYLNLEFGFKFNKNAKDYEVENIVARYEELKAIEYINSFSYSNKLNKIEIIIKDENN